MDDRLFPDAESRRDERNRLAPFFTEIFSSEAETVITVSHRDLLSVFTAMFMGLTADSLESFEASGAPGGVSFLCVSDSGKRLMKRMNDRSFLL